MKLLFPLDWPIDQPITTAPTNWAPAGCKITGMGEAAERLERALNLPAFDQVQLSSDVPVGPRGGYLAELGRRRQGVALRFSFQGRGYHVGQDAWTKPRFNAWSLALMAEGLRQTVRHAGDALFERMISGFAALPAPSVAIVPVRAPEHVLGVTSSAPREVIEAAYRTLAKAAHPDGGGSAELMAQLVAARDAMLQRSAG